MSEIALLVGSLAIGAAGKISSGVASNQAAQEQAELQKEQANIALSESEREATQKVTERRKFLAEQRMAYSANGISLVGTPGIVAEDTFKEFQMEIDAIRKSGAAKYFLGLRQAESTSRTGRAQLTAGILEGVGSAGLGFASLDK